MADLIRQLLEARRALAGELDADLADRGFPDVRPGHAALFMGMYVVLGLKDFPSPWKAILSQALANSVVGIIGFAIVESLPGAMERRRFRRSKR